MNHTFDIGIVGRTIFILDHKEPKIVPNVITAYNPEDDRVGTKSLEDEYETSDFCLRALLNRRAFFEAELAVQAIMEWPNAVMRSATSLLDRDDVSPTSKDFIKYLLQEKGR